MGWGKEIRIISLLTLDTVFFLLEIIIGYMSHSLALIADSFHMLNDIIALLVALWAVDVAKNRNPDSKYTYGWKRAEILGALVNAVFLIALCFSILVEALQRLIEPQEIQNPRRVMYVGCAGLVSNITGMFLFHEHGGGEAGFAHGHSHGGGDIESGHGHGHEHDHGHNHEHSHEHGHGHSHDNLHDHNDLSGHEHEHIHPPRRLSGLGLDDADTNCEVCRATINDILPDHVVHKLATECDSLLGGNSESAIGDYATGGESDDLALLEDGKRNHKKKHSSKSLNMHGVFLHVLGDALGNIGVIVSALFIWKTNYSWRFYFDPVVSLLITLIIFSSAIPLSRRASKILLQATPSSISTDELEREILQIPGVVTVHDFHVWNLTESIFIASIHVQISGSPDQYVSIAKRIRSIFHMYGIHSATVQPEFVSGEVSKEMLRRFSRIAGNIRHTGSPSSSIRYGTPDNSASEHDNTNDSDAKRGYDLIHTSPVSYGSTNAASRCLIDDAVHCNTDDCLGKGK